MRLFVTYALLEGPASMSTNTWRKSFAADPLPNGLSGRLQNSDGDGALQADSQWLFKQPQITLQSFGNQNGKGGWPKPSALSRLGVGKFVGA